LDAIKDGGSLNILDHWLYTKEFSLVVKIKSFVYQCSIVFWNFYVY